MKHKVSLTMLVVLILAVSSSIEYFEIPFSREILVLGALSALLMATISASGKSTLSVALEQRLHDNGVHTYRLDGDNIRHGLNKNLGFSPNDRAENIRRIGEVAHLMVDAGLITLAAFISPYREDRANVRRLFQDQEFIEVYVDCGLKACEARDPKGLYKKARAGNIKGFTGIDAPYEAPESPEIHIDTEKQSLGESIAQISSYLEANGYIG